MSGITQTYTTYITDDAGRVQAIETNAQTGISEEEWNVTAPGEGDIDVPLTISYAEIDTLVVSLTANVPYWWATGNGDNPITADVTTINFACAGTTDATVKGGVLLTTAA